MSQQRACITTSWDDGHPHDFRVAELLSKYKLTGTFYIPKFAPTGTMPEAHVRDLGSSFEIGAHTIDHVFLPDVEDIRADEQISGSKKWVEDVTGRFCPLFCPPAGKFHRHHLKLIKIAGFTGLRTVEFMSVDHPRHVDGLLMMPTTLQACPHDSAVYLRNFAKRFAMRNLWNWIMYARSPHWARNVRSLLKLTLRQQGVFHLWGHSWEITEHAQWDRLEYAFKLMSEVLHLAPCITNGELCRRTLADDQASATATVASSMGAL
ncbi:MAG TPA: polysaccharide deacetylase family protein [Tepidisphaeraceae bacterium]|jgi:peptidoglycan/xylan/chitin deacetylase (PgdA/CDA1 family)